ncbi:MAG: membrane protein insertase YidC [Acidimicrobiales bacterium]
MLNPIAKPIADVLAAFYAVIPNFGIAILLLSVVWMILISPLTLKSTRSMLAMQALQPELAKLKEKHRNDKAAFAQAQMDLFRERGVSPFGSCLPTILPLPVFFALFRVIDGLSTFQHGTPHPQYLNPHTAMYQAIVNAHGKISAFGVNLADNALSHHASLLAALPFYLLLLAMIGTQYYQTAMTMNRNPAAAQNPQMKMMKYIPIVFGFICIRFPAGVILYYAMSNLCRIVQQVVMYRYDPKVKALVVDEVREIEAKTRDIDRAGGTKKPASPGVPAAGRPKLRELLEQSRARSLGQAQTPASGTKGPGNPKAGRPRDTTATNGKPAPTKPGTAKPASARTRSLPTGQAGANGAGTNGARRAMSNGASSNGASSKGSSPPANGAGTSAGAGSGARRGPGRNIPPPRSRSKKRRGR